MANSPMNRFKRLLAFLLCLLLTLGGLSDALALRRFEIDADKTLLIEKLKEGNQITFVDKEAKGEDGSGAPSGRPVIHKQPDDVKVKEGGKVTISVSESGATGITWRLYNPSTDETMLVGDAPSEFRGLKVSGKNSDNLRLSKVPAELNGWEAYCTLANKQGRVETRNAVITVTDKKGNPLEETAQPSLSAKASAAEDDEWEPDDEDDEAPRASAAAPKKDGEITVTAVGAYLQELNSKGKPTGQKYALISFDDKANVAVTADIPGGRKVDYWVINGVRYDFAKTVKSIIITELTWDLDIEAVYTGKQSQTLLSPEQIQAGRTGRLLEADTIHAKMCHLTKKDKGSGGWFTEFDFTEKYTNRATKKKEEGGQLTVQVKATVPDNKKVSYWKFNEAHFDFDSYIASFIVRTLNTSFTYEPVFMKTKQTEKKEEKRDSTTPSTPSRTELVKVVCKGCTFSGGGCSNATTGKVPKGTKITVKSAYSAVNRWVVNGKTVSIRLVNPISRERIIPKTTITRTINEDTTIVCYEYTPTPVIN